MTRLPVLSSWVVPGPVSSWKLHFNTRLMETKSWKYQMTLSLHHPTLTTGSLSTVHIRHNRHLMGDHLLEPENWSAPPIVAGDIAQPGARGGWRPPARPSGYCWNSFRVLGRFLESTFTSQWPAADSCWGDQTETGESHSALFWGLQPGNEETHGERGFMSFYSIYFHWAGLL